MKKYFALFSKFTFFPSRDTFFFRILILPLTCCLCLQPPYFFPFLIAFRGWRLSCALLCLTHNYPHFLLWKNGKMYFLFAAWTQRICKESKTSSLQLNSYYLLTIYPWDIMPATLPQHIKHTPCLSSLKIAETTKEECFLFCESNSWNRSLLLTEQSWIRKIFCCLQYSL